jgi:AraC-like DNA-binding protein
MQYLACWRLQVAAQDLLAGPRPIAAVAERVGYESEAAFNRAFKRQFGMPPASWRRSQGRAVSDASPSVVGAEADEEACASFAVPTGAGPHREHRMNDAA